MSAEPPRPFAALVRLAALMAPVVMPSWRFFDVIAPSPRLEYAGWRAARPDAAPEWCEVAFEVPSRSWAAAAVGLVWNPSRVDTLFLLSCCERVLDGDTDGPAREIVRRLVARDAGHLRDCDGLRFRLATVERQGGVLVRTEAYGSPVYSMSGQAMSRAGA